MKNQLKLYFCISLLSFGLSAKQGFGNTIIVKTPISVCDSVRTDSANKVVKKCRCEKVKKQRRTTKLDGKPRTKAGKFLWDVFDIFKAAIPFVNLI